MRENGSARKEGYKPTSDCVWSRTSVSLQWRSTWCTRQDFWEPENCSWFLKVSKPKHITKDYCSTNSLNLQVSFVAVGEEFRLAREAALMDACVAWNAIDGSKKHRISLPASGTGPNAIHLPKGQQDSNGAVLGSSSDEEQESSTESD